MANDKIKQLVVTVVKRENKETGEKFDTYKVSTSKGGLYDLKFRKEVPEEVRPKVSSVLFVNLEDIDFQQKNRSFPVVWIHGVIGFMPLVDKKAKIDSMFKDVEGQEDEEDEEEFEAKIDPEDLSDPEHKPELETEAEAQQEANTESKPEVK